LEKNTKAPIAFQQQAPLRTASLAGTANPCSGMLHAQASLPLSGALVVATIKYPGEVSFSEFPSTTKHASLLTFGKISNSLID
jgi:hypothetical protein